MGKKITLFLSLLLLLPLSGCLTESTPTTSPDETELQAKQQEIDELRGKYNRAIEENFALKKLIPQDRGSNLSLTNLSHLSLHGVNLAHSDLQYVNFTSTNLSLADLSFTDLRGANFHQSNLLMTNLTGARTSNIEHCDTALISPGWFCRNQTLVGSGINLSGERLSGVDFNGMNLHDGTYIGTNFSHAVLYGAYFYASNLTLANLSGANLNGVYLESGNLAYANFTGADIRHGHLQSTDLSFADFTNANLTDALLQLATFEGTIWNNTICPDGTNSDENNRTCVNNLVEQDPGYWTD